MKLIMKYQKREIFLQKKDKGLLVDELRLIQYINGISKNDKFDRRHIKSTI